MAFCRLVLPLLVLSVVQSFAEVQVPVYLWGDLAKPSLKSYPLVTKSREEFEFIVTKELKNAPFTVVFVEETLSVEDFSRKSSDGNSAFPYLHSNIGDAVYVPSVDSPLDVLKSLSSSEDAKLLDLTENGLSGEIDPKSSKFLFITLKDARDGESRLDMLRRHNDFMENVFVKLQEKYDVVAAIYTAQFPSWVVTEHNRYRRQASDNSTSSNQTSASGRVISFPSLKLYVDRIYLNNENILAGYTSGSSNVLNLTQDSTLNFLNNGTARSLTLNFDYNMGYWLLDNITITTEEGGSQITETLEPVAEVYSLEGNSYRCNPNVTFRTINETQSYTLVFQDLKIQPFFNDSIAPDSLEFGESYNCIGFFSIPIWSGLFVAFILLSIMFYGIMMMMDIRTMDRFDDPKGKTITINAE